MCPIISITDLHKIPTQNISRLSIIVSGYMPGSRVDFSALALLHYIVCSYYMFVATQLYRKLTFPLFHTVQWIHAQGHSSDGNFVLRPSKLGQSWIGLSWTLCSTELIICICDSTQYERMQFVFRLRHITAGESHYRNTLAVTLLWNWIWNIFTISTWREESGDPHKMHFQAISLCNSVHLS